MHIDIDIDRLVARHTIAVNRPKLVYSFDIRQRLAVIDDCL